MNEDYGAFIAYIVDDIYKPLNEGNLLCMPSVAMHTKAYTDGSGTLHIEGE